MSRDARIARFMANGAVDLDALVGAAHTGHRFKFRCPMCDRIFVNDQEMEPMCTGPRWTNDHEPTVMVRISA